MKTILALSFLVVSTVTHAGPSVSGGIAYHEDFESCKNTKAKVSLTITADVTPKMITGRLTEGKVTSILKCTEGNNKKSKITGEELVFACNEERAGEGQLYVEVTRNVAGLKYASVFRKDIIQRNSLMNKLSCDQQVSNK
ncbi:MAG: hypothetical protein H7177_04605 [Rhizobacter sp.]|nr:hypothetical protein [Bacteriovorax sp.]